MYQDEEMLNKKIGYPLFCLLGIGCALGFFGCAELASKGNVDWFGRQGTMVLGWSLAGGIFIGVLLGILIYRIGPGNEIYSFGIGLGNKRFFLSCLLVLFMAWIPYFLAYCPGICAYDAVTQIGQIETGEYVEHHPLAHTLYIRLCLYIGQTFLGSANNGVSIYTLSQMFFLALAISYALMVLRRYGYENKVLYIALAVFALYPFNAFMSISMTKDVIFTAFFLFQVLALIQLMKPAENEWKPGKWDILFAVSSVGMILFRNNGKYAFLLLGLGLLIAIAFHPDNRICYARILAESLASLLVALILLGVMSGALKAQQADRREMLSLPIQQLSRCMLYHGGVGVYPQDDNTMSKEDKAFIRELFMEDGYENYMPHISDPVKNRTLTSVIRYNPKQFLVTYFRLFKKYPNEFINAALELNAGYLSAGDTSHAEIYREMYPDMKNKGLGYVQTWWWESAVEKTGITHDSKWDVVQDSLNRWTAANKYLEIPFLKYIFVPGIWLWWGAFLLWSAVVRKDFAVSVALSPVAGYFLTLLLGPAVQLRYVFPVMLIVPVFTMILVARGRRL